jgi:hypothetical protein
MVLVLLATVFVATVLELVLEQGQVSVAQSSLVRGQRSCYESSDPACVCQIWAEVERASVFQEMIDSVGKLLKTARPILPIIQLICQRCELVLELVLVLLATVLVATVLELVLEQGQEQGQVSVARSLVRGQRSCYLSSDPACVCRIWEEGGTASPFQ